MIVEHAFITTLESNQALSAASEMLRAFGFFSEPAGGGAPTTIERTRGRSSARRAAWQLEEQPQRVRVDFDRGRVDLAVSIEPWGQPIALHRELTRFIAVAMEERVTDKSSPESLLARWRELHGRIRRHNWRKRRHRNIGIGILLGIVVLTVVVTLLLSQ